MEDRLEELNNKIEQSNLKDENTLNALFKEISAELGETNNDIENEIKTEKSKSQTANTRAQNKFKKQYFLISEEYIYYDENANKNKRGKRLTAESSQRMIELYIEFMKTADYVQARICEDVIKDELKKSRDLKKLLKTRTKEISKLQREMKASEKAQRIEAKKEIVYEKFQEYREKVEEQIEQEKIAQEQMEQERIAQEQMEQERIAQEQMERERIAQEQMEQERIAQEQEEDVIDVGLKMIELFDSIESTANEYGVEENNEGIIEYTFEEIQPVAENQEIEAIQFEEEIQENTETQSVEEVQEETTIQPLAEFQQEDEVQDAPVSLWRERFYSWGNTIDEAPQDDKAELIKIKNSIVKTIKTIAKERRKAQKSNDMQLTVRNQNYREAFAEVNEIIKLMPEELSEKLPKGFKKIMVEEASEDYIPQIQEPIENIELKDETKIILGLMYNKYLQEKQNVEEVEENIIEEVSEPNFIFDDVEEAKQENTTKVEQETIRLENIGNIVYKVQEAQSAENKEQNNQVALAPIQAKKEGIVKSLVKFVKKLFSRKGKASEKYGEV